MMQQYLSIMYSQINIAGTMQSTVFCTWFGASTHANKPRGLNQEMVGEGATNTWDTLSSTEFGHICVQHKLQRIRISS